MPTDVTPGAANGTDDAVDVLVIGGGPAEPRRQWRWHRPGGG